MHALSTETLVSGVPVEDGVFPAIPERIYHGDKLSLSCSGAKTLLKSPHKFDWQRSQPEVHKPAFDLGHYVHGKALGVGEPVVIIDAPDYKTKGAQEARDAAYAAGHVPVLAKVAVLGDAMAAKLLSHPVAGSLLANGDRQCEQSAFWRDPVTGVRLRARFDVTVPVGDWLVIGDVKTTGASAERDEFGRTIAKLGYFIQDAWYGEAATATRLAEGRRIDFVFFVVETEPPHLVDVLRLPQKARDLGRLKMRRAIDLFAECTANDHWPDWPDRSSNDIHQTDLPAWFYNQEED